MGDKKTRPAIAPNPHGSYQKPHQRWGVFFAAAMSVPSLFSSASCIEREQARRKSEIHGTGSEVIEVRKAIGSLWGCSGRWGDDDGDRCILDGEESIGRALRGSTAEGMIIIYREVEGDMKFLDSRLKSERFIGLMHLATIGNEYARTHAAADWTDARTGSLFLALPFIPSALEAPSMGSADGLDIAAPEGKLELAFFMVSFRKKNNGDDGIGDAIRAWGRSADPFSDQRLLWLFQRMRE